MTEWCSLEIRETRASDPLRPPRGPGATSFMFFHVKTGRSLDLQDAWAGKIWGGISWRVTRQTGRYAGPSAQCDSAFTLLENPQKPGGFSLFWRGGRERKNFSIGGRPDLCPVPVSLLRGSTIGLDVGVRNGLGGRTCIHLLCSDSYCGPVNSGK